MKQGVMLIVTGHQGFFTTDALKNIAETTLSNLSDFEQGRPSPNEVRVDKHSLPRSANA